MRLANWQEGQTAEIDTRKRVLLHASRALQRQVTRSEPIESDRDAAKQQQLQAAFPGNRSSRSVAFLVVCAGKREFVVRLFVSTNLHRCNTQVFQFSLYLHIVALQ